jgi:hypothetical protein
MSDLPTDKLNTTETPVTTVSTSPTVVDQIQVKTNQIFNSWKLKAGLAILAVVGALMVYFFWAHIVAVQGMKGWSTSSGAQPISCMIKDTNDDGYVSCSALLEEEVVPLECGASIFNVGCRINYGAAAPSIKVKARNKI